MNGAQARRQRTPGRGLIRFGILLTVLAFALPNALGAGNGHGGQGGCKKHTTCTTTDTTAPSDAIIDPSGGAQVSKTITVTGTASDNVGIASVQVAVDGGSFKAASGTTSWTYSLDTSGYPNGQHTVTSRATDTSGNVGTAAVTVDVENAPTADTTAPVVAISAPASGATVSGTVTVSGWASDAGGLAGIAVSVDGGTFKQTTGSANWSYALDTSTLSDASHTITARGTDTSGNTGSASVTVSVSNATSSPSSSPTHMVTPEGVTIDVNTAGSWTAQQIYDLLKPNALQLSLIGPHLTIKVQDTYGSQTTTSASSSNGVYTTFSAIIYLKGINSTFSVQPDAQLTHEYGHAWTLYHLYIDHNGVWSTYLHARWTTADGSTTLATDSRLDSSYIWDRKEIIADDYRLLFGDALAISERSTHLNPYIPQPKDVSGLRSFLLNIWGAPG